MASHDLLNTGGVPRKKKRIRVAVGRVLLGIIRRFFKFRLLRD
jgi:hypothetical protein